MSVHYKFKSALEYDTLTFDGLHISVNDLKSAILQHKRIGKNSDFDLQVTNAQTKEVFEDGETLIPKNTSLLIARVPLATPNKSKAWTGYGSETVTAGLDDGGPIGKSTDLSSLDASEDDKIRAMISQSTQEYDPSNYLKIRGANQVGAVPPNYRCYKCHQGGHWIKDCTFGQGTDTNEVKKATGIPRSFMIPVTGPNVIGAMITPSGSYAVPAVDHLAYQQPNNVQTANNSRPDAANENDAGVSSNTTTSRADIPEDLLCSICNDLLIDAVMIPCCGNSFCDECVRNSLLESDHECPDCHERDISPTTLIPNRFLRKSVSTFKNESGYIKNIRKQSAAVTRTQALLASQTSKKSDDLAESEKLVISEADSTQTSKQAVQDAKDFVGIVDPRPVEAKADPKKEVPAEVVKRPATKDEPIRSVIDERKRTYSNSEKARDESNRNQDTSKWHHHQKDGNKPIDSYSADRGHYRGDRSTSPHVRSHRSPRRGPPSANYNYRDPLFNKDKLFNSVMVPGTGPDERAGTPTVDEPGIGPAPDPHIDYAPPSFLTEPHQPPLGNHPPGQPHMPPVAVPPHMGSNMPHMQLPPPRMNVPPPGQFPPRMPQPPHPGSYSTGPPPNFRHPPPGAQPPFLAGGYNNDHVRPMFDGPRPQLQPPLAGNYQNFAPRGRMHSTRPPRGREPLNIIDDPLEEFNRILREKDERKRRAKQRKERSYSRSSSRSFSRSPPPLRRRISRSPRRRNRSRSRSFSVSRSRSRSFTPLHREFSPRRHDLLKFRSPPRQSTRSPQTARYRYKDKERHNEREVRDEIVRGDRRGARDEGPPHQYSHRQQHRPGFYGDREHDRDREREYYNHKGYVDNYNARGSGGAGGGSGGGDNGPGGHSRNVKYRQGGNTDSPVPGFYPPPESIAPPLLPLPLIQSNQHQTNRYREFPNPRMEHSMHHSQPQTARYEDVAPPGMEQPLPPGEENTRIVEKKEATHDKTQNKPARSDKQKHDDHHRYSSSKHGSNHKNEKSSRHEEEINDAAKHEPEVHSKKEYNSHDHVREHRASYEIARNQKSPSLAKPVLVDYTIEKSRRRKSKEKSPDKHKVKKVEKREREESDDEKTKKNRDKKKKREKKEKTKEKKREKKERKESKRDKDKQIEKPIDDVSPHDAVIDINKKDLIDNCRQEMDSEELFENDNLAESSTSILQLETSFTKTCEDEFEELHVPICEEPPTLSPQIDSRTEEDEENDPDCQLEIEEKEDDDVLDLHASLNDMEKELLQAMPEKSKWETEDDIAPNVSSDIEDAKSEKGIKVSNEVLKRAENAIFAKAINAIRPIEIKKISQERVRLYAGEKDIDVDENIKSVQVTLMNDHYDDKSTADTSVDKEDVASKPPQRLSVKERLGCKVDELDRIVKMSETNRNRSRSLSPLSKKSMELHRSRRIDLDFDHDRFSRRTSSKGSTNNARMSERNEPRESREIREPREHREIRETREPREHRESREHREHREHRHHRKIRETVHVSSSEKFKANKTEEVQREARSRSPSSRKRDKKTRKEKSHEREPVKPVITSVSIAEHTFREHPEEKPVNRAGTPDIELNKRLIKQIEKVKSPEASSGSDTSSSEDKKHKKHKKHKKRRRHETSSSSDSSSSSEDEREKRRKKHKKKIKKKKRSKRK